MSKEHKPCPFCGETEALRPEYHQTSKGTQEGWVECMNCGARGQTEYGCCSPDEMVHLVWSGWDERSTEAEDLPS